MKKIMFTAVMLVASIISSATFAQEKTIVQTAIDAGNFKTLVTAVKAAGLVDTLNGHTEFTVFAPTDDAFAKVDPGTLQSLLKPENKSQLAQVLTYHVLSGSVMASDAYDLNAAPTVNGQRLNLDFRGDSLRVGDAQIVVTDIPCSNGVIHVIDTVLIPEFGTIPATAQAAGQFDTLVAAVGAAGLADVLGSEGPFTVFAPTDEAFSNLPSGTVETLLKPENKQDLINILKYHVIAGRVYASDAVKVGRASTLLGRSVDIGLMASGITVNNAKVIVKNIDTTNGVIHVIDSVLIPGVMSRSAAMDVLASAISEGAPVYNAGNHGKCCKLYMDAMESIVGAGVDNTDERTLEMVSATIRMAERTHDTTERAWVLRRGMDSLYGSLSSPRVMRTRFKK
jgi:uncharacterized surface protein with fasciclin (FAS1) repeats